MARLGVTGAHHVVLYDQLGLFSAPRLWFQLQLFGLPAAQVAPQHGTFLNHMAGIPTDYVFGIRGAP